MTVTDPLAERSRAIPCHVTARRNTRAHARWLGTVRGSLITVEVPAMGEKVSDECVGDGLG